MKLDLLISFIVLGSLKYNIIVGAEMNGTLKNSFFLLIIFIFETKRITNDFILKLWAPLTLPYEKSKWKGYKQRRHEILCPFLRKWLLRSCGNRNTCCLLFFFNLTLYFVYDAQWVSLAQCILPRTFSHPCTMSASCLSTLSAFIAPLVFAITCIH